MDAYIGLLFAIGIVSLVVILFSVVGILGFVLHWAIRTWKGIAPDDRF